MLYKAFLNLPSSLNNLNNPIDLANLCTKTTVNMKSLVFLFPFFILILPTTSLFILLPLYVYPGTSASGWSNLTAAIAAYPNVQWQVIVNPNSGPGTTPTAPYPNQDWITGIAKLNSYKNVQTLGYVSTNRTNRAYSAVTADISGYAAWASYPSADISVHGIFFDEVNTTDTSSVYTYMQNASAYAKTTVPSVGTHVVFNPGVVTRITKLFDYCDTMVEFENAFSEYHNDSTIADFPAGYLGKSAIIVHDTPKTADVQSLVHTMALDGVGAVYFSADSSTDCCYKAIDSMLLTTLVAAVQAG